MSRWHGPAGKGAMKQMRLEKRREAEIRQAEEQGRDLLRDARYRESLTSSDTIDGIQLLRDIFMDQNTRDLSDCDVVNTCTDGCCCPTEFLG